MLETLFILIQDYLFKVGFLILNGLYILFLFIIFQQANAMKRVINTGGDSNLIIYFALANIVIGILIFLSALVIL
jgi:hypothetical protein